jgi:SAM-dependent methyltransferase
MILSWYRQNARDFGTWRATSLLVRVAWRRAVVKTCNALLAARVECPCCQWAGNRFLDYKEMGYSIRNIECPQCGSHSRHRAFFLWLRDDYQVAGKSGTALVFAPEKALMPLWETAPALQTVGIDIEPTRDVDVLGDVMRLPFVADVADIVWCHHVLEQVTDDHQAMTELKRVLKSRTGQLILSAGMSGDLSTREFGRSEKALSGNRRSYGADLAERLSQVGLVVEQFSYGLKDEPMTRYAIRDEPFYVCRKS